jgi:hypothetical protein
MSSDMQESYKRTAETFSPLPFPSPSWKLWSFQEGRGFQEGRILVLAALAFLCLWAAGAVPARAQGLDTTPHGLDDQPGNAFVSPLEPTLLPTPAPTASPTWTPTPEPPPATATPDLAAAAVQISPLPVPGTTMRSPLDVGAWLWVSGSALLLLIGALAIVVTQHPR